ncbi:uncharacterized protein DDB_G0283357-like [Clytia hemisphaerica]|uniref:uncharacterized protein DDB_G0283357-like n=1 Tax=Clytia hemisphaerica TaxID=252671 RepID=UPI0034D4E5ED
MINSTRNYTVDHTYDAADYNYDFTTDSCYDYDELREGYDADLSRNYIKGKEIIIMRRKDNKANDVEHSVRKIRRRKNNIETKRHISPRHLHGEPDSKYSHGDKPDLQCRFELRETQPRNSKTKKKIHSYIHVPLEEMEGFNLNAGKDRRKVRVVKPRIPHQDFTLNEIFNLNADGRSKHQFNHINIPNKRHFGLPDSSKDHRKEGSTKTVIRKGDSLKLPSRQQAQYEDVNIDKVVMTMTPSEFKQRFVDNSYHQENSFDQVQGPGDFGYNDNSQTLDIKHRRVSVQIEKNSDINAVGYGMEEKMLLPNPSKSADKYGIGYENDRTNEDFKKNEDGYQNEKKGSVRNYNEGNVILSRTFRERKKSVFEGPDNENVEMVQSKVLEGPSRGKENWKRIIRKIAESNKDGVDLNNNDSDGKMNVMSVTENFVPGSVKHMETAETRSSDGKSGRKVSFSLSGDLGSNEHFGTTNLRSPINNENLIEHHGTSSNDKPSKHKSSTSLAIVRKYKGESENIIVESDDSDNDKTSWFHGQGSSNSDITTTNNGYSNAGNEMQSGDTYDQSNSERQPFSAKSDKFNHLNQTSRSSNIPRQTWQEGSLKDGLGITEDKDDLKSEYISARNSSLDRISNVSSKRNSRKASEVISESPIHPVKEVKSGAENWAFVFERLKALNMMEKVNNAKPNILNKQANGGDSGSKKSEYSEKGRIEQNEFEIDNVETSEPSERYEGSLPDYDYKDHYDYDGEKKKMSLWAKVKHAFRRQKR